MSIMELINAKYMKCEPIVEYINRWHILSLDYKDHLTNTSIIEMCIQRMYWELLYILEGIKPRTLEELVTRAHDMEISIVTFKGKDLMHIDQCNEMKEVKKSKKSSKGKDVGKDKHSLLKHQSSRKTIGQCYGNWSKRNIHS